MSVLYKLLKTYGALRNKATHRIITVENDTVGIKNISRHIQQATSLTSADVVGAITALKEEIAEELKMGNGVHLPGIGYFSLAIKGEVYEDPRTHRFRLRNPKVRTVKFRPDTEFLESLQGIEFENATYRRRASVVPTAEDIDAALAELFAESPVITVSALRHALHLSQAYAYILAERLAEEGKLKSVGTWYRKLYARGKGGNTAP